MNRVKKTIVCKYVDTYRVDSAICKTYQPSAGDVAVFEITEIGKHTTLQCETKRNETIFVGDSILAVFGNRYATEQFEGYVSSKPKEILDVLAIGGVIGVIKTRHEDFKFIPTTKVRLIGYAVDNKGK